MVLNKRYKKNYGNLKSWIHFIKFFFEFYLDPPDLPSPRVSPNVFDNRWLFQFSRDLARRRSQPLPPTPPPIQSACTGEKRFYPLPPRNHLLHHFFRVFTPQQPPHPRFISLTTPPPPPHPSPYFPVYNHYQPSLLPILVVPQTLPPYVVIMDYGGGGGGCLLTK